MLTRTLLPVRLKNILLASFVITASILTIQIIVSRDVSAYDGGRIIDDHVFLDARSMDAGAIQNFLTSKGAGLANMNFVLNCYGSDSKERQWYTAVGAPCDQSIPASHIIYYAAQIYGVSPKVILATMQKEQSLATAPNPTSWQINQAMGYGCPTSGQCGGNSTFAYQIDSGTWALRYHYERARGNNSWWNQSSGWVCGSEKNYYKPSLYPYQNVNFYDENGTMYRTHYIANPATSAFYCYTPHAYNNPQGLYGRAPYGHTGMYYSGSYNFVLFYESWFGSTRGAPFQAQYESQSPYPIIDSGTGVSVYFQFRNIGTSFWKDDLSNFPGYRPIRLANTMPINRSSMFRASNWAGASRPTGVLSAVYESDGVTKTPDQHTVFPGQIGRYEFTIYADPNAPPGVYREYFQPILEGAPNWEVGGLVHLDIGINRPDYRASFHSQGGYPTIARGGSSYTFFRFTNTGGSPWYDQDTVWPGKNPVRLATTWPINRSSSFAAPSWPFVNRPVVKFYKVLQPDGVTQAPNQHVVHPGQIAEFAFTINVPVDMPPGVYREYFQPIAEGAPFNRWDMGAAAWTQVTVE